MTQEDNGAFSHNAFVFLMTTDLSVSGVLPVSLFLSLTDRLGRTRRTAGCGQHRSSDHVECSPWITAPITVGILHWGKVCSPHVRLTTATGDAVEAASGKRSTSSLTVGRHVSIRYVKFPIVSGRHNKRTGSCSVLERSSWFHITTASKWSKP